MKLIKDAKDKIILVSYSFKVNPQIQERLKTKSKLGTLSEIVIVYGRTELKPAELEWIKEIQDLKIYEKLNLHAKCYLNEERAIICSMNLYDYSQQNNIEMGILITKEHDKEAYQELIDEINNIKINGTRKSFDELNNKEKVKKDSIPLSSNNVPEGQLEQAQFKYEDLTLQSKLTFQVLRSWREGKSKEEKIAAFHILTDKELTKIAAHNKLDKSAIYDIMPKKNAIKYADEILDTIKYNSNYTIGKVLSVWYQSDNSKYDRVKLEIFATKEQKWFDTTQELPDKDKIVAVKLNGTWFNQYLYLDI